MEELGFVEVDINLSKYKIAGTRFFVKGNTSVTIYDDEILAESFPHIKENVVINDNIYLKVYDKKYLLELLKIIA